MSVLATATQYTFYVAFLGMAASTVYFLAERSSLDEEYRNVASISATYTFIAAMIYWFMKDQVGLSGTMESIVKFPTEFRYIDWILTTPLILLKFPALLGEGDDTRSIGGFLVVADLVMIITGFIGESSINAAGGPTALGWIMFGVSMIAWLLIIYILYSVISKAQTTKLEPVQRGLNNLKKFIAFGWSIYPIGYLLTLITPSIEMAVARELVYNIADIVNKCGFGLVAVYTVKQIARDRAIRAAIDDI
jgi:sensory rhodopsin